MNETVKNPALSPAFDRSNQDRTTAAALFNGIVKFGPKYGQAFQSNTTSLYCLKRHHQVTEHRATRDSFFCNYPFCHAITLKFSDLYVHLKNTSVHVFAYAHRLLSKRGRYNHFEIMAFDYES